VALIDAIQTAIVALFGVVNKGCAVANAPFLDAGAAQAVMKGGGANGGDGLAVKIPAIPTAPPVKLKNVAETLSCRPWLILANYLSELMEQW